MGPEFLSPDLIRGAEHLIAQMGDNAARGFGGQLAARTAPYIIRLLQRAAARLVGSAGGALDDEELRLRLGRLESTIDELFRRSRSIEPETLEVESREPSAIALTATVVEASSASRSSEKRKLLGAALAKRLGVDTESYFDLQLRRVAPIVNDLNEGQIAALGAIMILTAGPRLRSHEITVPFDWFEETVAPFFEYLNRDLISWNQSDLEHLVAVNALREYESDRRERGSARESFSSQFHRNKLSTDAFERFVGRFMALAGWSKVDQFDATAYLLPYRLTPPGAVIAGLLLESLLDKDIIFVEWEDLDPSRVTQSQLIAPFDWNNLEDSILRRT